MPKSSKVYYYAVKKGRIPGVYLTWDECDAQVKGFSQPVFKKFADLAEAEEWANAKLIQSSPTFHAPTAPTSPSKPKSSSFASKSSPIKPILKASAAASSSKPNSTSVNYVAPSSNLFDDEWEEVYTDGACRNNQGKALKKGPPPKAGLGVWWGPNDPRNVCERCPGEQTNNRAELIAIIRVLEMTPQSQKRIRIKTDSKYCINCASPPSLTPYRIISWFSQLTSFFTSSLIAYHLLLSTGIYDWLPKWQSNSFLTANGKPVSNVPLIKYLAALLDLRCINNQKIRIVYVKGHSDSAGPDSVGNNAADTLAVRGCDLAEEIEDDWDALRALVEEETNMIRELRVNGLTDAMGSNAGIAAQAGKPGRQTTVEVEEENVVKEITISKEEFDPRDLDGFELLSDDEMEEMAQNQSF
ncbi:ribonuclease H-like protein [Stereum hirsutum FP-91666 SS1]|uniref:ribonuclease H-like protein n=1 Tax=Stereum hirsutum (strain FP-91666) TaxID=721885 RepID=UPI000440EF14|nr:ribonuclease H-like protein [Stereum hirsutum FP-91666 SS1]EIM91578.1 ribonuclease H-like protein [Stereum hirsutum FP-91666 SS1]